MLTNFWSATLIQGVFFFVFFLIIFVCFFLSFHFAVLTDLHKNKIHNSLCGAYIIQKQIQKNRKPTTIPGQDDNTVN